MKNISKKTSSFKSLKSSMTSISEAFQNNLWKFDHNDAVCQLPIESQNVILRENALDKNYLQSSQKSMRSADKYNDIMLRAKKDKQNDYMENITGKKKNKLLKQRQNFNQIDQKYTFTFNKNFNQTNNSSLNSFTGQNFQSISSQSPITLADDFFNSFRIIFSTIIDLHFLRNSLSVALKYVHSQIFTKLMQIAETQLFSIYQNVDLDKIVLPICKILKDYRLKNIKQVLQNTFPYKLCINCEQFAKLFEYEQSKQYVSKTKQHLGKSSLELFRMFFKVLIEQIDIKKKLKMVCSANQSKFIQIVVSISEQSHINADKLADLLYFDAKSAKKWQSIKCKQFLADIFEKNQCQVQFVKWVRNIK